VFEIQIRSILQHAWAEIEHDLGYKSAEAIPRHIRRRFARLAGVLELADDEFGAIRDDLAAYANRLTSDVQEKPESVFIDRDSLETYIRTSERVADLDRRLAEACDVEVDSDVGANWTEVRARAAAFVGFSTISALDNWLERHGDFVIAFGKTFTSPGGKFVPGASAAYALHVCAGLPSSVDRVSRYLETAGYEGAAALSDRAQRIIDAVQEAARTHPLPNPPTS
jgi:putative GTP pyrophosphokinase